MHSLYGRTARRHSSSRSCITRCLRFESLEYRQMMAADITGSRTNEPAYLVPTAPGVEMTPLVTVGDSVGGFRMVGIPDGLGAYDNGDGTFTVLMNHEIPVGIAGGTTASPAGAARAHGNAGAFVSKWIIRKSDFALISGGDILSDNTSIFLSNNDPSNATPHTGFLAGDTTVISRLCSADLAAPSAHIWTDPVSGITYGTSALIFETGEESGGIVSGMTAGFAGDIGPEGTVHFGRQFAFIATDDPRIPGNEANTAFELPHHGLFAWENNLTSPFAQRKTVVMGMDDSNGGQVYVWVGDKQTSGNVVERAGLTKQSANDSLYVIKVAGTTLTDDDFPGATNPGPSESRATPLSGTFTLEDEGDISGLTFAQLEALSDSKGGTQFLRPEDGQWDPNHPNDFYFVTTDRYDEFKDNTDGPNPEADGTPDTVVDQVGRSRLYRLRFTDIRNPQLGGTIEAVLDGTEAGNMFDNMTIDNQGRVFLQEDVGNQAHSSKIWMCDIATDQLIEIAQHNPALFGDLGVVATAPYNQDEESSGIISLEHILGEGYYLADVQAHYNPGDAELVEGGQLLVINTNVAKAELTTDGVLRVHGTINNDRISVLAGDDDDDEDGRVNVFANGRRIGSFDSHMVLAIHISAHAGNDFVLIDNDFRTRSLLDGGAGNDLLVAGRGRSILIGGLGADVLVGGSDSDALIGNAIHSSVGDALLLQLLVDWSSRDRYTQRVSRLRSQLSGKVLDDATVDFLYGNSGDDWFVATAADRILDRRSNEQVN